MLFLQLPLFLVFLPGGDNEDESISFKLIAISLFYNHSCTQNLGSSWLGEFQMQVWDSRFGTFVYLWPLSKGNFSNEELMELQKLFHLYFIRLAHVFHNHVIQWKLKCKPEAWLSLGRSLGPGHLMLFCHISGFYPKPIWQGTQRSDILPNLRISLDVAAGEVSGLSYWVKHSSLGGQDIILYWHSSVGWIFLAVIVSLVLLTGLAFWHRKCWWVLCVHLSCFFPHSPLVCPSFFFFFLS
uniref:MHC class I-like antigen recognition-like domain-containing protein n=1 Tax=Sus scrofa TaxID=9823 RepID=A0A4X1VWY6_PIG